MNYNYKLLLLFALLNLYLLVPFHLIASDDPINLSVGVASMDITPDPKVNDWVTGKPYSKVHDPLSVKTLIIGDGNNKVVIVAWDLVDAGESATDEVRKAISSELNIPKDRIIVNASHNHSAPWAPVYNEGYRGKERDTWWAIRHMPAQNNEPNFKKWMKYLIDQTVKSAKQANDSMREASIWIGRVNASEFMNNRRPRNPEWGVEESNIPSGFNYKHKDWNPDVLVGGASFGPMDRTMTLISFRDNGGKNIVSIFNLSIHSVAIYPYSNEISSDWPGETSKRIKEALGGEAIFLQGAAGDINPWKRGREAVNEMGAGLAKHAEAAYKYSARLKSDKLNMYSASIGLPLSPVGVERTGQGSVVSEVKVLTIGSLALVTLPGEPLTDLGSEIRRQSPFPQTLVLGYSNGNGVHYVGMPCEKQHGGYEMNEGTVGAKEAGSMLVETAVRLLDEAIKNVKK